MIGKSEQRANPIIMICCSDKATRKEAEASIRASGLLDQEEHCGFGLGSAGFPLETNFLPHSLGRVIHSDMNASNGDVSKVEVHALTEPGIGRKLRLVASRQRGQTMQYATGGPIMHLDGHMYQLTVAHAIKGGPSQGTHQEQDDDFDDCDFDGQSDVEEMEPDASRQNAVRSLRYSNSYPQDAGIQGLEVEEASATRRSSHSERLERGRDEWNESALLGSFTVPNGLVGELDYMMIKLPTTENVSIKELNQIRIDEPPRNRRVQVDDIASVRADTTRILAITSRGAISGSIVSDSTSFMTSESSSFQQLLTVLLSNALREGDSGSAIIDVETGDFYGHVVLGVDGDCVAYVLPSPTIMADITAQSRKLPSFHHVETNERQRPTSAFSDQQGRVVEVPVSADFVLKLQTELIEAQSTVERLRSELREKRSALESAREEALPETTSTHIRDMSLMMLAASLGP